VPEHVDRPGIRAVARGENALDQRMEIERFDGARAYVINSAAPLFDAKGQIAGSVVAIQDVTGLKRMEEALRESEERFRAIFEHAAVGIQHLTLEGDVVDANPRLCATLGYGRDELLGRNFRTFTASEDLREEEGLLESLLAGLISSYTMEKRYIRKDGQTIWVRVSSSLYAREDAWRRISVVEDITTRKAAESELVKLNERLLLLSETSGALLATNEPQQIVNALCRKVLAALDCQAFFNFMVDDQTNRLHLNAFAGIPADEGAKIEWLDYGVAVCGCAARDGSRIVAENISETSDPRTDLVKAFGIQAYACHPLMAEGKVIGTLSFGSRSKPRFTEDELALMKAVADQVAIAMERRNLYARAEEGRRILDAMMDYIPEGITIVDAPDGRVRLMSRYGELLLGCSLPEGTEAPRLTQDAGMVLYSQDGSHALEATEYPLARAVAHGEIVRGEEVLLMNARTGESAPLLCNAGPIYDRSGSIIGAVMSWLDITERKRAERELLRYRNHLEDLVQARTVALQAEIAERRRAEQALREREAELVRAQQVAHVGSWWYDPATRASRWADEMFQIFGVAPQTDPITYEELRKLIHPADWERFNGALWGALTEENPYDLDIRIVRPDGEIRTINMRCEIQRRPDNALLELAGTAQDITERKRAEESLRASETRLAEAQRMAHLGNWEWDLQTREMLCSDEVFRIYGYPERAFTPDYDVFMTRIHPDDLAAVREIVDRAVRDGDYHETQYRLIRPDGEIRVVRVRAQGYADEAGAPLRFVGTIMDITDQARAEEEARLRENQLIQADKMASLGTLVSGVAHEINNPNHAILSNASLLKEAWRSVRPIIERLYAEEGDFAVGGFDYSDARDKIPQMFDAVIGSSRRIQVIVQELRDFARYNPESYMIDVEINTILRSVVVLMTNMVAKCTDRFEVVYGDGLPAVHAHFQRIERVLINLIQNACHALSDREKGICVTTGYNPDTHGVTITVRDEGVGIRDDDMRHITDPFFTTKRDIGGTGLGLWISSNIIHEHGGTLTFTSAPGQGTTAIVALPAASPQSLEQVQ
jgi:PAS domain S-box-containing protein